MTERTTYRRSICQLGWRVAVSLVAGLCLATLSSAIGQVFPPASLPDHMPGFDHAATENRAAPVLRQPPIDRSGRPIFDDTQPPTPASLSGENVTQPPIRLPSIHDRAGSPLAEKLLAIPRSKAKGGRPPIVPDAAGAELVRLPTMSAETPVDGMMPRLPRPAQTAGEASARPASSPQSESVASSQPQASIRKSSATSPVRLPEASVEQPAPRSRASGQPVAIAPTVDVEMRLVARRAAVHTRRGFSRANRMAYYSARAEFVEALGIVARAMDAREHTAEHSEALAAGLRALKEADDFVVRGSRLEANLNFDAIIKSHQTPVLQQAPPDSVSSLIARQRYYTYAQQQLSRAAAGQSAASMALYGLGRVYEALAGEAHRLVVEPEPKALVFHQAALDADKSNFLAANEIGVLLAHFGRYGEARAALEQSIAITPRAMTWRNLSVVFNHLGDRSRAADAQRRALALSGPAVKRPHDGAHDAVEWVSPEVLSRSSAGDPVPRVSRKAVSPKSAAAATRPQTPRRSGLARMIPWLGSGSEKTK